MPGSNEPIATLLSLTSEAALLRVQKWLGTTAPGVGVSLVFRNAIPRLGLPRDWYYDFTSQLHRPLPLGYDPSDEVLVFDCAQLGVDQYIVEGPIPALPV